MEYILWGISFQNIHMILGDSVQVFYSGSDKGGKNGRVISADDPANMEFIMNEVND